MASTISVAGAGGCDTTVHLRVAPGGTSSTAVMFIEGDQITDEDSLEILGPTRCSPEGHLQSIAGRFPDASPVLLVMPTTVVAGGQACFGNFVCASTATGEPLGFKPQEYRATTHLHAILAASGVDVGTKDVGLELVGFSKGAVVLNQLLTEMAWHEEALANSAGGGPAGVPAAAAAGTADPSPSPSHGRSSATAAASPAGLAVQYVAARGVAPGAAPRMAAPADARFLDSIRTVHFLDAGLNSRGVHITDVTVAHWLGRRHQRLALDVWLHGTPRQWADRRRPWIAAEKTRFVELLKAAGLHAQPSPFKARRLTAALSPDVPPSPSPSWPPPLPVGGDVCSVSLELELPSVTEDSLASLGQNLTTLCGAVARVVDALLAAAATDFGVTLPPSVTFACSNASSSGSGGGTSLTAASQLPSSLTGALVTYFGGEGYRLLASTLGGLPSPSTNGGCVPADGNLAALVVAAGGECPTAGSRVGPPLCPPSPPVSPPATPPSPPSSPSPSWPPLLPAGGDVCSVSLELELPSVTEDSLASLGQNLTTLCGAVARVVDALLATAATDFGVTLPPSVTFACSNASSSGSGGGTSLTAASQLPSSLTGALVTYFGGEGYRLLASTLGGLPSPSTNGGCVPADGNLAALVVAAGGECPTAGSRVGPPLCPPSPPVSPPATPPFPPSSPPPSWPPLLPAGGDVCSVSLELELPSVTEDSLASLGQNLTTLCGAVARVVDALLAAAATDFGVTLPPSVTFACSNASSSGSGGGTSLTAASQLPSSLTGALVTYFGGEGYRLLASTLGGLPSPSTNGGCVPADGNLAALVVAAGGECPTAGSRVGPPLCPPSPPVSPPATPPSPPSSPSPSWPPLLPAGGDVCSVSLELELPSVTEDSLASLGQNLTTLCGAVARVVDALLATAATDFGVTLPPSVTFACSNASSSGSGGGTSLTAASQLPSSLTGALVTYFGGEGYRLLASTLGGLPSPSTNGGCVPADGNLAALVVAAGGECPTAGSRVGPPLCPPSPPVSPPATPPSPPSSPSPSWPPLLPAGGDVCSVSLELELPSVTEDSLASLGQNLTTLCGAVARVVDALLATAATDFGVTLPPSVTFACSNASSSGSGGGTSLTAASQLPSSLTGALVTYFGGEGYRLLASTLGGLPSPSTNGGCVPADGNLAALVVAAGGECPTAGSRVGPPLCPPSPPVSPPATPPFPPSSPPPSWPPLLPAGGDVCSVSLELELPSVTEDSLASLGQNLTTLCGAVARVVDALLAAAATDFGVTLPPSVTFACSNASSSGSGGGTSLTAASQLPSSLTGALVTYFGGEGYRLLASTLGGLPSPSTNGGCVPADGNLAALVVAAGGECPTAGSRVGPPLCPPSPPVSPPATPPSPPSSPSPSWPPLLPAGGDVCSVSLELELPSVTEDSLASLGQNLTTLCGAVARVVDALLATAATDFGVTLPPSVTFACSNASSSGSGGGTSLTAASQLPSSLTGALVTYFGGEGYRLLASTLGGLPSPSTNGGCVPADGNLAALVVAAGGECPTAGSRVGPPLCPPSPPVSPPATPPSPPSSPSPSWPPPLPVGGDVCSVSLELELPSVTEDSLASLGQNLTTLCGAVARVVDALLAAAATDFGVTLPPSVTFACSNASSSGSGGGTSLTAASQLPSSLTGALVTYFGGEGYRLLASTLGGLPSPSTNGGCVPADGNLAALVVAAGGECPTAGSRVGPPLCPPSPPVSPPATPPSPPSSPSPSWPPLLPAGGDVCSVSLELELPSVTEDSLASLGQNLTTLCGAVARVVDALLATAATDFGVTLPPSVTFACSNASSSGSGGGTSLTAASQLPSSLTGALVTYFGGEGYRLLASTLGGLPSPSTNGGCVPADGNLAALVVAAGGECPTAGSRVGPPLCPPSPPVSPPATPPFPPSSPPPSWPPLLPAGGDVCSVSLELELPSVTEDSLASLGQNLTTLCGAVARVVDALLAAAATDFGVTLPPSVTFACSNASSSGSGGGTSLTAASQLPSSLTGALVTYFGGEGYRLLASTLGGLPSPSTNGGCVPADGNLAALVVAAGGECPTAGSRVGPPLCPPSPPVSPPATPPSPPSSPSPSWPPLLPPGGDVCSVSLELELPSVTEDSLASLGQNLTTLCGAVARVVDALLATAATDFGVTLPPSVTFACSNASSSGSGGGTSLTAASQLPSSLTGALVTYFGGEGYRLLASTLGGLPSPSTNGGCVPADGNLAALVVAAGGECPTAGSRVGPPLCPPSPPVSPPATPPSPPSSPSPSWPPLLPAGGDVCSVSLELELPSVTEDSLASLGQNLTTLCGAVARVVDALLATAATDFGVTLPPSVTFACSNASSSGSGGGTSLTAASQLPSSLTGALVTYFGGEGYRLLASTLGGLPSPSTNGGCVPADGNLAALVVAAGGECPTAGSRVGPPLCPPSPPVSPPATPPFPPSSPPPSWPPLLPAGGDVCSVSLELELPSVTEDSLASLGQNLTTLCGAVARVVDALLAAAATDFGVTLPPSVTFACSNASSSGSGGGTSLTAASQLPSSLTGALVTYFGGEGYRLLASTLGGLPSPSTNGGCVPADGNLAALVVAAGGECPTAGSRVGPPLCPPSPPVSPPATPPSPPSSPSPSWPPLLPAGGDVCSVSLELELPSVTEDSLASLGQNLTTLCGAVARVVDALLATAATDFGVTLPPSVTFACSNASGGGTSLTAASQLPSSLTGALVTYFGGEGYRLLASTLGGLPSPSTNGGCVPADGNLAALVVAAGGECPTAGSRVGPPLCPPSPPVSPPATPPSPPSSPSPSWPPLLPAGGDVCSVSLELELPSVTEDSLASLGQNLTTLCGAVARVVDALLATAATDFGVTLPPSVTFACSNASSSGSGGGTSLTAASQLPSSLTGALVTYFGGEGYRLLASTLGGLPSPSTNGGCVPADGNLAALVVAAGGECPTAGSRVGPPLCPPSPPVSPPATPPFPPSSPPPSWPPLLPAGGDVCSVSLELELPSVTEDSLASLGQNLTTLCGAVARVVDALLAAAATDFGVTLPPSVTFACSNASSSGSGGGTSLTAASQLPSSLTGALVTYFGGEGYRLLASTLGGLPSPSTNGGCVPADGNLAALVVAAGGECPTAGSRVGPPLCPPSPPVSPPATPPPRPLSIGGLG
ncbi:hypothetical protein HYH02_006940 [Chlamydomonas schloesseri]|uniref:Uncharacterized protein n=1 Tax=Chlamydomonas schloesseri TaxID=2026947 RepID=A0A836B5X6_9CHLO|nr:hypothetical protein HYH02_006940 [Chlamydomonas schloesseri]|eukprot:KAG2448358.1 hypothetical protein HYH02_006940 [Chlamydomonas schloesseri]